MIKRSRSKSLLKKEKITKDDITNSCHLGVQFPGERAKVVESPFDPGSYIGIKAGDSGNQSWKANSKRDYLNRVKELDERIKAKLFASEELLERWVNGENF